MAKYILVVKMLKLWLGFWWAVTSLYSNRIVSGVVCLLSSLGRFPLLWFPSFSYSSPSLLYKVVTVKSASNNYLEINRDGMQLKLGWTWNTFYMPCDGALFLYSLWWQQLLPDSNLFTLIENHSPRYLIYVRYILGYNSFNWHLMDLWRGRPVRQRQISSRLEALLAETEADVDVTRRSPRLGYNLFGSGRRSANLIVEVPFLIYS